MFKLKPHADQVPQSPTGNTLIGSGTTITGDLVSNGDIRIDGTLNGNISGTAKVVLGATGVVLGDINCNQADIQGKVTGKLMVKDMLYLRGEASIEGDIHAGRLQIDPQVTFNGHCHMGKDAFVVEMATEEKLKAVFH
jgi:cytoskeletal protein CcmA (bactofilin family)